MALIAFLVLGLVSQALSLSLVLNSTVLQIVNASLGDNLTLYSLGERSVFYRGVSDDDDDECKLNFLFTGDNSQSIYVGSQANFAKGDDWVTLLNLTCSEQGSYMVPQSSNKGMSTFYLRVDNCSYSECTKPPSAQEYLIKTVPTTPSGSVVSSSGSSFGRISVPGPRTEVTTGTTVVGTVADVKSARAKATGSMVYAYMTLVVVVLVCLLLWVLYHRYSRCGTYML